MYKGNIKTVNGIIKPNELGFCQCHEHIYIKNDIDDIKLSMSELAMYKKRGGKSIVDATPQSVSSGIKVFRKISKEVGVNIICSTGFHKTDYYKKESNLYSMSITSISDKFISEIEEGCGIIKTAVCGEIDGIYRKWHESAVICARETGSPIICHIDRNTSLLDVISFYKERKVEPSRLILCHADRFVSNINEHIEATKEGAFLEYDTIAREKYHCNEKEIQIIKTMIDKGFQSQLLLSLDTTIKRLSSCGGNVGLTYILEVFIPLLKANYVTESQIEDMMVNNSKRALCFN